MRSSLLALATVALLLCGCSEPPKPTMSNLPATTAPQAGSPTTASGKTRVALLLPLSGRAAAIGQSMQQAAEMSLFDSGARELALAAYDSGDSAESAVQAFRKARSDGVAIVLGPLFGNSAAALSSLVRETRTNVISFSNDEAAAQPGVWIMGISAPPQVRRVIDHAVSSGIKRFAVFAPQTAYGEQMARTLESHVAARGGTVVAVELFDDGPNLAVPAQRLVNAVKTGEGKLAVLVPVAPPRVSAVLAALAQAELDRSAVQFIGTGVWDTPGIGAEPMLRGAWYAAPDPAKRADFERRYVATYGRPPHRLATLSYDAVALAGHLARKKPGGDFSAEAITSPNGWSGVDGPFRLLPDGRAERTLAVIEIQGERGTVVSPAATSFTGTN